MIKTEKSAGKLEIIRNFYHPKLKEGVLDHEVLGWESREAQIERFRILSDQIPMENLRILDVGCGLANLLEHFKEENIQCDYTGVDILEEMVDRATRRHPEARFLHKDIFSEHPFDKDTFNVIYSSGIFNIDMGNNRTFLTRALKLFLNLSDTWVAFNLLHHNSPGKEEGYFYFNPEGVSQIIEEENLPVDEIRINEDYLTNDFTVILKKRAQKGTQ